ncbi:MAG: hypothetical protein AB7E79_01820 [Rhodospirillaceae bacterium]
MTSSGSRITGINARAVIIALVAFFGLSTFLVIGAAVGVVAAGMMG